MVYLIFLTICVSSTLVINYILREENIPPRARRSVLKKLISFWIAISIILYYRLDKQPIPKRTSAKLVVYLEANGTLSNRREHTKNLADAKKPVIFITTTDYSVVQIALLTRLGQTLYPVRDKVIWIVVLLPLESSADNEQVVNKSDGNITFGEAVKMRADVTKRHMKFLKRLLTRFGVPFVLFRSYKDRQLNTTWNGLKWPNIAAEWKILKGCQAGLWWALKSLSRGVVLFGGDQFTYDSALFLELQDTIIASTWPIGLSSLWNTTVIAGPIVTVDENEEGGSKTTRIIGYKTVKTLLTGSIQIGRGTFAIDLEYLRTHVPFEDQWKLCLEQSITNADINIKMRDIQAMGKQGSEIYMWRTITGGMFWPDSIKVRQKVVFTEITNIKTLLKTAFGPRYYLMNELVVEANNHTKYMNYDFDRDIAIYLDDDNNKGRLHATTA